MAPALPLNQDGGGRAGLRRHYGGTTVALRTHFGGSGAGGDVALTADSRAQPQMQLAPGANFIVSFVATAIPGSGGVPLPSYSGHRINRKKPHADEGATVRTTTVSVA